MESVKMKHSLNVIEEQSIAVKDESENERKTAKGVDQTRKKKSYNLRFNTSANGSNPMDNNQQTQQLPHPINERRPRIRKTEYHCWKLEYKPYNKHEVLEKLKQEIYEKNIQRELELQIKSRIGFRSVAGEPKSASTMPRIGSNVTSVTQSYLKKREVVPKDLRGVDYEKKKDIEQGTLTSEIKDLRVKSSTRLRTSTIPKNKNRVTVGGMSTSTSGSAHEGNKGVTTFVAHLENHMTQETHKTSPHIHSVETLEKSEKRSDQNRGMDAGYASSTAWVDTGVGHRHPPDTRVPTNEILEKYFSSNIFPPLSTKSKHEDKERGHDLDNCTSPVKCWTKPEETPTQFKSDDNLTKKNTTAWKKESNELPTKIKAFIEKPVPEISPSSLLIHRRSTVADISMSGFSKAGSTTAHAPPPERKKSIGVVNIHTCPNANVFTDRSWMYQDRRAEKCRYIRAPQTPIPPISEVFHPEDV